LAPLGPGLLLKHLPHQVPTQRLDGLTVLGVAELAQQPFHRVQCSQYVVARERTLVRPRVPDLRQVEHQRPDVRAEGVTEHLVPGALHPVEKELDVLRLRIGLRVVQPLVHLVDPPVAEEPLPGLLTLRTHPIPKQVERLAHPLTVRHHHGRTPPPSR
jgi:hypothetical protein